MQINWLLLVLYVLTIVVEIGLPVTLGVLLLRKYKSVWVLIITGMIAYAVAQLIHIPALSGIQTLFNNGSLPIPAAKWIPLLNGVIVGGLTGILENITRWIGFKVNGKAARPFRSALALGIGFGGVEIAIVGILLAVNLGSVLFYNAGAAIAKGATTAQVQSVLAQIANYWSSPWFYSLLSLFEHLVTFAASLVLAVMVWKSVSKAQPLWLLVAVLFQIVFAGITTFLSGLQWGLWEIEGILLLFLLLSILLMYFFWNDEGGLDSENEEEEDEDVEDEDDDEDEDDEEDVDESEENEDDLADDEELDK